MILPFVYKETSAGLCLQMRLSWFSEYNAENLKDGLLKMRFPLIPLLAFEPFPSSSWPPYIVEFEADCICGNLGEDGMKHLCLLPEAVSRLNFYGSILSRSEIKGVCEFIQSPDRKITHLNINTVYNENESLKMVATLLKSNKTLKTLSFGKWLYSRMDNDVLNAFSEALMQNETLQEFECSSYLEVRQLRAFMRNLPHYKSIEVLKINADHGPETILLELTKFLKSGRTRLKRFYFNNYEYGHGLPQGREVAWWLQFNRYDRWTLYGKETTLEDWMRVLIKTSADDKVDFSYELLRIKPDFCIRREEKAPVKNDG